MEQNQQPEQNSVDLDVLLLKVRSKYPYLTASAKKVADYITSNFKDAVYLGISQLADRACVSEATITKFVRQLGYSNFHEFKIGLARTKPEADDGDKLYGEINLDDDITTICTSVFYNNMDALKDTLKMLDPLAIDKTAESIVRARKIDLYGMGSSTVATLNARMRLYRLGIMCFTYNDPHEQIISASLLKKGDTAIAISNSGRSQEVVKALSVAKASGAATICITSYDDSPIVQYADVKLFTSTRDSEQLNESLNARVAELTLIDALYVCIASKIKRKALENLRITSDAIKLYR